MPNDNPPCVYELNYPSNDPYQPVLEVDYDLGDGPFIDINGNPIPEGYYTFENAPRI